MKGKKITWLLLLIQSFFFFFFFFTKFNTVLFYFLFYNIILVLPYIDMNPSWVYMCSPSWTPLQPPFPSHPSGSSQCSSPEHPVSCIEPGLVIRFIYYNIHVSVPFSQTTPPLPSPTESKRLLYICVSFAISHTGLLLLSF